MAVKSEVFLNAQVLISTTTGIGNNDVSDLVTSVEFTRTYDILDDTTMGESAHSRKAGLETATATVEFVQRFSTEGATLSGQSLDSLLQTLADLSTSGSSFLISFTPGAGLVASDNPRYSFLAILEGYSPMTGSVGDILKTSVPFQSGGGSVTRASSS
jgi:hypothetical protein